jgi:hypothetical protein
MAREKKDGLKIPGVRPVKKDSISARVDSGSEWP